MLFEKSSIRTSNSIPQITETIIQLKIMSKFQRLQCQVCLRVVSSKKRTVGFPQKIC